MFTYTSFPSSSKGFCAFILFSFLTCSFFGQTIGSWSNGDLTPRKMEAALPTAGTLNTDVNLFNGELQASEVLGTVSTPSGLSFTLTMNYHNDILLGSTPSVLEGVPYGKGWSLNIPTINISVADYQSATSWNAYCDDNGIGNCPTPGQLIDPNMEGDMIWHSLNINLPGVASGKAIFKNRPPGIDASAQNGACFVLESFDTYLEIWRVGSRFIAVTQDGIYYNFDIAVGQIRNPVSARYEKYSDLDEMYRGGVFMDTLIQNNVLLQNVFLPIYQSTGRNKNLHLPKEEYLTFYLSYIYNSNSLEGISFNYEKYGGFDYHEEYNQVMASNDFRAFFDFTVNSGISGIGKFRVYNDILLKSIHSATPLTVIDELELVYATNHVSGTDVLNHADPGVERLDSLYNYKTVFSTISSGCTGWKRFYHRKMTTGVWGQGTIGPFNPYVDTGGNMNIGLVGGANQFIPFNHAFVESPRIGTSDKSLRIPGDMYELKTTLLDSDPTEGANIDFNIVTGINYDGEISSAGLLNKTMHYDTCRSETIYSTFGKSFKWNSIGDGNMQTKTSSLFSMPFIPQSHNGYYIQIGPANSDNKFNMGQDNIENLLNNSYYSYYHHINNYSNDSIPTHCPDYGTSPELTPLYAHDRVPSNFGIGLPWSGVLDAYRNVFNLEERHVTPTCCGYFESSGFQRWWNNTDATGQVTNVLNPYDNEPTYCDNNVSVGEVELVRYSKNPYMLSQVNTYKYSGNTRATDASGSEARKLIGQKVLRYEINLQNMYSGGGEVSSQHQAKYLKDGIGNWIDDYDQDGTSDRLQGIDAQGVPAGAQDYNLNGVADWDEDLDNNGIPDGYQYGRPLIFPATRMAEDEELLKTLLSYSAMGWAGNISFEPSFDSLKYVVVTFNSFSLKTNDITKTEFFLSKIVDVPVSEKEETPLAYNWNNLKNYPHVLLQYNQWTLHANYEGMELFSGHRPFGFSSGTTIYPSLKVLSSITDKLGGKKEIEYYSMNHPVTMGFGRGPMPPKCPISFSLSAYEEDLSTPRSFSQFNAAVKSVSSINENGDSIKREYEYDITTYIKKYKFYLSNGSEIMIDSIGNSGISAKWKSQLRPDSERGFGKVTEYFPDLGNPAQRSKSIHYFHSTPIWQDSLVDILSLSGGNIISTADSIISRVSYDSLTWRRNYFLFGKLRKTENYNYLGQKVSETENEYEVNVAFENGMQRLNFKLPAYQSYEIGATASTGNDFAGTMADLMFSSAYMHVHFGERNSNLKSYFLKKTKDISREFDAQGICQNTTGSSTNPSTTGIYQFDDEVQVNASKLFPIISGSAYSNEATLSAADRDHLIYQITKEGATVSNMLYEFGPFPSVTDTVLETLAQFEGESVYPVMKERGPFSNKVIESIARSSNLSDAEKHLLISPQAPLQESFLLANTPINGNNITDEQALVIFKASSPVGRGAMNYITAKADSLSADFILEVSIQQPWLNEDYLAAMLNKADDFPSGHLLQLLSHSRILTDAVYEAILNMDSLPDGNTLLALATGIAYPSDTIFDLISSKTAHYDAQTIATLINSSPRQLPTMLINKLVGIFDIPLSAIVTYHSNAVPIVACYPDQYCNLALEQITEYDYYDANYKGQSYSPGYNSFKPLPPVGVGYVQLEHEPSWMIHCKKTYSPQQPDAWSEQRYYFFWDRRDGNFPASDVFEKMNAMGWRSLAYQTMERSKACGLEPKERSTFYYYDRRWQVPPLPEDRIPIAISGEPCPPGPNPPVGGGDDPRPDEWYEFEVSLGMVDDGRFYVLGDKLAKRLMLREINVQAAEPVVNDHDHGGFMQTEDETDWQPLEASPLRLVDTKWIDDENYEIDKLGFVYPCPVVRTAHILHRNLYHQPWVVEDEKGLQYRYFYEDPVYYAYEDTANPCNSYLADVFNYPGMPVAISIGSGLADSLYTTYTYDPNTLLLTGETDPNGMVSTYQYDKWRRPKAALINGEKVGENRYHYWNEDTYDAGMSFADRAKGNWMEAVVYNSTNTSDTVEQTRSYADPLGRAFHTWSRTVTAANLNSPASALLHSGEQVYDAWGRVIKAYKPFVKTGASLPLQPLANTAAGGIFDDNWSSATFENDPRSRLHFSTKPAATGTETHQVAIQYNLITGSVLACELDMSLVHATEMMPEEAFNDFVFRRTKTTDEDGKTVWEYTYPNGQKVGERRRIAGQSYATTLFYYDSRGNLRKTVNPEKQQSVYKYNLAGNLYEKITPDDGTVRYMYNRSGQVVLEQDALMRKGVPLSDYNWDKDPDERPDLFPYYRQYCYDIYGRMVLQQKLLIQPWHTDPPNYQLYLSSWPVNALAYADIDPTGSTYGSTNLTDDYGYHFIDRSSLSWLAKAIYKREFINYSPISFYMPMGIEAYYIYEGFSDNPPLVSHATVIPEKKWVYGYNVGEASAENMGWSYAYECTRARGRLSFTLAYKDAEDRFPLIMENQPEHTPVVEATWLGYNNKGQLHRERHRVNNNGISTDYYGYNYTIEYPAYDLRGNALQQIVDIKDDGKADMRYTYTYDARGRLKEVYMALGTAANDKNKIASYAYDDARGTVSELKHSVRCGSSDENLNTIDYIYDHRDRLTQIKSTLYRERLFYDAQQDLMGLWVSQNYNGNINATEHRYLHGANGTNTFNYSAIAPFNDDTRKITAYGYTYDGLNRLTAADAKVGQHDPTYGDVRYSFDRIGNIKRHRRGWLYSGSNYDAEIWDYKYYPSTNRLRQTQGLNLLTATRNYRYDSNGNLATDSYRDVVGVRYDRANLPTRINRDYHDNVNRYTYNAADQRIAKVSGSLAVPEVSGYELYLRDAAGRELATIDIKVGTIEWYGYGTERIARFRPQSDQRNLPVLTDFAATPGGMLLNDNSGLVQYPIDIVYGTAHDMTYIYRKDYLERLDTVPEIPDTLARSFVPDYEVTIEDHAKMLMELEQARIRERTGLRIIEQGGVGPVYRLTPWNPWIPVTPEGPENPPPPPPVYPLICHCPGRVHIRHNEEPVVHTYSSFSNKVMENITFYLYDHLGNTRVTYYKRCNFPVTVENILDYDPYGKVLREFSNNDDKERYVTTQHERDKETGYDYRGARFYDCDIARFLSVDPKSQGLPQFSSYVFCLDNPIGFIDQDGAWPWPIWARSFISASAVGGGRFRGDGREASLATDKTATSRTWVNFTYDAQRQQLTNQRIGADKTVFYGSGRVTMPPVLPPIPRMEEIPSPHINYTSVTTTKNSLGSDIGSFGFHYWAKDPITPGLFTPSLDVHAQISISENLQEGLLFVSSMFTGDRFPSTEAFIEDQSGSRLFLGARKEQGGVKDLFGDNKHLLFNELLQIKFDDKGNFQGVYDRKNDSYISPDAWNKQIQSNWDK